MPPSDATAPARSAGPAGRAARVECRKWPDSPHWEFDAVRLGVDLGQGPQVSAAGPGGASEDPWARVRLAQEAERLGYDVAWAAEAYGTDAVTVLSCVAARTTRIGVGSAVLQIPALSAAMTAMRSVPLTLPESRSAHILPSR